MMRFKGQRVVVTGSSRNTGAGLALAFAREGASVVVNGTQAGLVAATANDVAEAVLYLASAAAGNVTGARLVVDGGVLAQLVPGDVDG
jgi:NAD(P)-dependent dehydrogenase (short-subunit alcohol dehydrogenase family)